VIVEEELEETGGSKACVVFLDFCGGAV